MTQHDALLAAVCASPEDDLPRLVFADWCEENGDPDRAEFIRAQIEIAKGATGKKLAKLRQREKDLLAEHSASWTGPLLDFTDDFFDEPLRFRRGFVEDISIDDELLEEHGDELFRLAPIRTLRMGDQDGFNGLHKCRHLLRITTLDLTVSRLDSTGGSPKVFRSKYLANLEALIARGVDDNGHLNAEALEAIVTSKHLTNLRHLDIGGNWLLDNHLSDDFSREERHLLALGSLPHLRELVMDGIGLGPLTTRFAMQPWLSRLTVLELDSNNIDDTGARALADSPHLERIERLNLLDNVVQHDHGETTLSPAVKRLLKRRFGKRVLV